MALRRLRAAHWLSAAVATIALCSTAKAAPRPFWLDHGELPKPKVVPFAPADALQYYGGEVISAVDIVAVAWGSGVDATYMSQLGGFYSAIVKSPWIDWMTEYDTIGVTAVDGLPGSNQHIGRGAYSGEILITPANTGTSLFNSDVESEIIAQIKAGVLPKPRINLAGQANTLYMIDFPPGITIYLGSSNPSCSTFGAYHYTLIYGGVPTAYAVHPYCGYGFDTSTVIHSHELAESITDMEVGLASSSSDARPNAWGDPANGMESGDLCNGTSATVSGYAVQKIWSNYAKSCVAEIPVCNGALTPPSCRPCNLYDDGVSCSGGTPACANQGPSQGQCVKCTAFYQAACEGTPTPVCDDTTNACVGCLANTDCRGASPFCDTSQKTCRPCGADKECDNGTVCDTGGDSSKGTCVECTTDSQCKGGFRCTKSHTCVAPPPPDAGQRLADAGGDAAIFDGTPPTADSSGCTAGSSSRPNAALSLMALVLLLRRQRSLVARSGLPGARTIRARDACDRVVTART